LTGAGLEEPAGWAGIRTAVSKPSFGIKPGICSHSAAKRDSITAPRNFNRPAKARNSAARHCGLQGTNAQPSPETAKKQATNCQELSSDTAMTSPGLGSSVHRSHSRATCTRADNSPYVIL